MQSLTISQSFQLKQHFQPQFVQLLVLTLQFSLEILFQPLSLLLRFTVKPFTLPAVWLLRFFSQKLFPAQSWRLQFSQLRLAHFLSRHSGLLKFNSSQVRSWQLAQLLQPLFSRLQLLLSEL